MKLSLNWLRELLNTKNILDEDIVNLLEQLGYEVEDIESFNNSFLKDVKIVKITDIKKHPNANKLSICRITDGKNNYEVVCGANNIYVGMIAPYIEAGKKLLDGTKIEVKKIRGVISYGMLCSAKELGISDDHSGILELQEDFVLGDTLDKYFNDTIVEISTPANRYDCLGHLGIAKELALKLDLEFNDKKYIITQKDKDLPFFDVKIADSELCSRYIAINIDNVDNKIKLPFFILQRIISCGIRSINPLVDISNYVMLEVGHSVHIFDKDKLEGEKIVVRLAKNEERILALDNKEYILDDTIIVIADDKKPIAIAGIIGAENSCVEENTKNIVIESAVFNRSRIRLARKKLGINTEASYRFERGSGWQLSMIAALRTQQLIQQYCGGEIKKFTDYKDVEYYKNLTSPNISGIKVDLNFLSSFLGIEVNLEKLINLLRRLEFEVILDKNIQEAKKLIAIPPLNRQDIKFQADIAEEYARFIGYQNIPNTLPTVISQNIKKSKRQILKEKIIDCLTSFGFDQVINYSLCSSYENSFINNFKNRKIEIINPISNEFSELRLSIFSGLIRNLVLNYNNQNENVSLFEVGKIYYKENEDLKEEERVGMILYGEKEIFSIRKDKLEYDYYYAKGVIESLFDELKIDFKIDYSYPEIDLILDKKLVNNFVSYYGNEDNILAYICEIDKDELRIKLPNKIFYCDIFFENLQNLYSEQKFYKSLIKYPSLLRDLCIVLPDESLTYQKIIELIKNIINKESLDLYVDIRLIDYYKKEDMLSLTISIKLQHRNKTLTDKEANDIVSNIIKELEKLGIYLRR